MGEVIDFNTLKPHTTGDVFCAACKHEWVGVIPAGVSVVQCPQCQAIKGVRKGFVFPDEYWACHCGSFLFIIPRYGETICAQCGEKGTDP